LRPVLVGVAGGSGAGKSTAVRHIADELRDTPVAVVHHDSYYRDLSHLTPAEREAVNYDHPHALETTLLVRHLEALAAGQDVDLPVYDFERHVRRAETVRLEASPVIILDGILILADDRLRRLLDLKVYVDTPDADRLDRRLQRDVATRGRSERSVLSQYDATVRPMHREFVEPSRRHADVVLANGGHDRAGVERVVARIRRILAGRQA
jgi:uridine kinase